MLAENSTAQTVIQTREKGRHAEVQKKRNPSGISVCSSLFPFSSLLYVLVSYALILLFLFNCPSFPIPPLFIQAMFPFHTLYTFAKSLTVVPPNGADTNFHLVSDRSVVICIREKMNETV